MPIIYLSVYANIRKAKECKGNEAKPIFCSGLLVFICYSVKTEEEPHQYFTQGSTSLGALLGQLVQRCAKKIMVILFFCIPLDPQKNLEERSTLLFSTGSPIKQMRFAR